FEPTVGRPAGHERAEGASKREDRDLERRDGRARRVDVLEVSGSPVEEAIADDVDPEETEREDPDASIAEGDSQRLEERGSFGGGAGHDAALLDGGRLARRGPFLQARARIHRGDEEGHRREDEGGAPVVVEVRDEPAREEDRERRADLVAR